MAASDERISRFGEYRGYATADYDGWWRFSQHVTVRDGTRIAIDYYRPTRSGALTCADKDTFATPVLAPPPEVSVLRGPSHPSHIVLPVIPQPVT